MLSQRNPPIKHEDACAAVWPAYEWKGKRAKGVDDARNDLGRGDADLWQCCLNTDEALWGDYTRYLAELGCGTSKLLRFPWDKDAGRLSPVTAIPQAQVAHSPPHLDIVPQAHEPCSMPIAEMDQPSPPSVDPWASAAPKLLPTEPAITAAESPPSETASPAPPPPPLGGVAAHASEYRSGPEATNGLELLPAGVPQVSTPMFLF